MIRTTSRGSPRRFGFTLIELLVVISIIAVLVALAAGTFFRVRVSQQEKATETTVSKLQSELDLQVLSVHDNCNDYFPGGIPNPAATYASQLAGGDNRRAFVIWQKLLMKLEFPQNFYEAMTWPGTVGLERKATYASALSAAGVANPLDPYNPANSGTMTTTRQHLESAVLLYLALTEGRRGNVKFSPVEHIGAHAVGKLALAPDPTNPTVTYNFDVFLDSWGNPICFIRCPMGMATTTDLNNPPYQQLNSAGTQVIDPLDPERTLLNADWQGTSPSLPAAFTAAMGYSQINYAFITNPPLNLTPVIFSAGRDGLPGIDPFYANDGTGAENDNVYAYRVKGPGRGNN